MLSSGTSWPSCPLESGAILTNISFLRLLTIVRNLCRCGFDRTGSQLIRFGVVVYPFRLSLKVTIGRLAAHRLDISNSCLLNIGGSRLEPCRFYSSLFVPLIAIISA